MGLGDVAQRYSTSLAMHRAWFQKKFKKHKSFHGVLLLSSEYTGSKSKPFTNHTEARLCCAIIVPAAQEAEVGGLLEPGVRGQPGQHRKTPSQKSPNPTDSAMFAL
jgi:hypothetical protein